MQHLSCASQVHTYSISTKGAPLGCSEVKRSAHLTLTRVPISKGWPQLATIKSTLGIMHHRVRYCQACSWYLVDSALCYGESTLGSHEKSMLR